MTKLTFKLFSITGYRKWDYNIPTLLLLTLLLLSLHTTAWAKDPGQVPLEKITISSDQMYLNLESGKSIYTGNVIITQGELVLTGDKVTLEQKDNELERMTVTGKPARYKHITEKGEPIEAESERMVYTASQNKLVMTTNARLQQPDHQVSSDVITYDTVKGIVMAGDSSTAGKAVNGDANNRDANGKTKNQRVNITLTPKKAIHPTNQTPPTGTSGKK